MNRRIIEGLRLIDPRDNWFGLPSSLSAGRVALWPSLWRLESAAVFQFEARLSEPRENPSKSSTLKHLPDRAGWLPSARNGRFLLAAGTISGTGAWPSCTVPRAARRADIAPQRRCKAQVACPSAGRLCWTTFAISLSPQHRGC